MLSKFHFSRHALGPLSAAADVGIATSTNAAYEMMKQGGQGGGQDGGDRYVPPGGLPVGEGMYEIPSPPAPSSQPLCLVEVGQRGREMWCMNSFLESSDCTLQGTCSVGNTVQCVTCTVDVDIVCICSVTSHENTVYNICDYYYVDIDNCCVNPGHVYNQTHICIAVFYDCAA